jgi:hypothetical protein
MTSALFCPCILNNNNKNNNKKCKSLSIAKRKIEMKNFTTENGDTMEAMIEDDIYKCLGLMQTKQAQMMQQQGDEYLHCTKSILKTNLNGKNDKSFKYLRDPILTFSCGIVKWTLTDRENLLIKMRTLLTRYRLHHPHATKE